MFAKIFLQILESSIAENPELRFTFMDFLILADINGVVDMTHEAIARRTNRPVEIIRRSIIELEGPDARSGTPDYEGARLKRLYDHRDWGWLIINYGYYRQLASEEQRREKTRTRVDRFRKKAKAKEDAEEEGESGQCVTGALHKKSTQGQLLPPFLSDNLPPPLNVPPVQDAWDNWQEHNRQRGKKLTEIGARAQIKKLQAMGAEKAVISINQSIENNWTGLFYPSDRNGSRATKGKVDYAGLTDETAV